MADFCRTVHFFNPRQSSQGHALTCGRTDEDIANRGGVLAHLGWQAHGECKATLAFEHLRHLRPA